MVTGVASALRADALGGDLEDAGVHRVEEVRRLHDAGDAVVDVVVDEERAEQRLLGLDVVRQARGLGVERRGRSVGHEFLPVRGRYSRPRAGRRAGVRLWIT